MIRELNFRSIICHFISCLCKLLQINMKSIWKKVWTISKITVMIPKNVQAKKCIWWTLSREVKEENESSLFAGRCSDIFTEMKIKFNYLPIIPLCLHFLYCWLERPGVRVPLVAIFGPIGPDLGPRTWPWPQWGPGSGHGIRQRLCLMKWT